jgi:hypothetical protein
MGEIGGLACCLQLRASLIETAGGSVLKSAATNWLHLGGVTRRVSSAGEERIISDMYDHSFLNDLLKVFGLGRGQLS